MALKTDAAGKTPTTAPTQKADTTLLELALFTNYTWGRNSYVKGKAYKFTTKDAMRLLAETDFGRPIWKIHTPAKAKEVQKNEPVDATMISAPEPVDEMGDLVPDAPSPVDEKRISIGDESEISDILNRDDPGNVTV